MKISKKIIITICLLVFILISLGLYFDKLEPIDSFFYNLVSPFKSPFTTELFKLITMLGSALGIIVLINIVLIIDKKKGLFFLINSGVITIANVIIKNIVMRNRPLDINLIMEKGYSFPSGHSMNSVAAYGLLIYYIYNSKLTIKVKTILISILTIIMLLITLSRVYLGVHYFTDVVAGTSLSIIWLMVYTEYLKKKGI